MNRRKQIIEGNEVSQMYTFSLGGYNQKVLIEGKKKDLPVVIFLHGGPGTPIPFNAGSRGMYPQFTDRFLMVYWDQLGCGINSRDLEDSKKVCDFVAMAGDLIREVKKLFPGNPVFLFAVSWGSVLSGKLLEAGISVDGVLVYGQITHNLFFNEPLKKALKDSRIPAAKLGRILQMERQTADHRDLQLLSSSLQKYTDTYLNHKSKKTPMLPILLGLLSSPDYGLKDFKTMVINGYSKNPELTVSLFRELMALDLRPVLKSTSLPYYILQGDTDVVATTEFVQEMVETSGNSNLRCEVIRDSGHFPSPAAMDRILNVLTALSENRIP